MGKYERFEDYVTRYFTNFNFLPYSVKDKKKNAQTKIKYWLMGTNQMFEWDGLPKTIRKRDLELLLQTVGYAIIIKVAGNLYAVPGGLGGELDQNFRPTKAIVANAYLETHFPGQMKNEYTINEDCVVIMNDACYQGLIPTISYYATELVENELSLHMADINTRIQTLLSAGDNNTIESARKFLKDLEDGELGVISEPKFAEEIAGLKATDYAGSGATKAIIDLIEYHQYLEGQCNSKLGVRAPFNMKREALGDSEVSQMDMALLPQVDNWLECREEGRDNVLEVFGEEWTVKLSSAWENIHREVEHAEEVDEVEEESEELTTETTEEEAETVKEEQTDEQEETKEEENTEEEKEEEKEEEEDEKKETE